MLCSTCAVEVKPAKAASSLRMMVTGADVLKLSRLMREPDTTTESSFCGTTGFWAASAAGVVLGASFSTGVVCAEAVCIKISVSTASATGLCVGLEKCAMFRYFGVLD